jgi:hypothetical protein
MEAGLGTTSYIHEKGWWAQLQDPPRGICLETTAFGQGQKEWEGWAAR